VAFEGTPGSLKISWWEEESLKSGAVIGGVIVKKEEVSAVIKKIHNAHHCNSANFSIPEQQTFLFEIEIPADLNSDAGREIEKRLEEEVPIRSADAVFDFSKLSCVKNSIGTCLYKVAATLKKTSDVFVSSASDGGIAPFSFDTEPNAIARAVIGSKNKHTLLIINLSEDDTGFYMVVFGEVRFASTVPIPSFSLSEEAPRNALAKEISRVLEFWNTHHNSSDKVQAIVACGAGASDAKVISSISSVGIPIEAASVWQNAFKINERVPKISYKDSLRFAVAAGLALRPFSYV
jgi:Tfp pilus assembly PilM family ATPase